MGILNPMLKSADFQNSLVRKRWDFVRRSTIIRYASYGLEMHLITFYECAIQAQIHFRLKKHFSEGGEGVGTGYTKGEK